MEYKLSLTDGEGNLIALWQIEATLEPAQLEHKIYDKVIDIKEIQEIE